MTCERGIGASCWNLLCASCKEDLTDLREHAPRWIPVGERLPEPWVTVQMVLTDPPIVATGYRLPQTREGDCAFMSFPLGEFVTPTHWAPLMEPPREVEP